ncbi:MAG TPA: metal-dependent hydrolase [Vicinamibacterales bacterium]|nr:metal-dependent hydrolase [Vicinamibacterales bacterium]
MGGLIVGEVLAPSALVMCAVAGVLPDIDFAWGGHNRETHSLGAALIAGVIVLAWKRSPRLAIAVTLSWSTHVLFDWLGSDDTPPLGVMALWPLNSNFYFANAFVFDAISRRYWLDNFITHNAWAVAREILILAPIAFIAFRLRGPRRFRRRGTT